MEDGEAAVGIVVHPHGRLDVVVAVAVGRDLQAEAPVDDTVVAADLAVLLDVNSLPTATPLWSAPLGVDGIRGSLLRAISQSFGSLSRGYGLPM